MAWVMILRSVADPLQAVQQRVRADAATNAAENELRERFGVVLHFKDREHLITLPQSQQRHRRISATLTKPDAFNRSQIHRRQRGGDLPEIFDRGRGGTGRNDGVQHCILFRRCHRQQLR